MVTSAVSVVVTMSDAIGESGWEGMGNTPIYCLREHRIKNCSQPGIRKEPSFATTPVSGWKFGRPQTMR